MADERAASAITLLALDVDGVLTDGSINLDDHGVETKRFHVRDGTGLKAWMRLGHRAAIITAREGKVVQHRARELGIQHVIQGTRDKRADFLRLVHELGLTPAHAAMVGDDLPDLTVMKASGYPIAVADAVPEIKQVAAYITTNPGGHGAVREAIEHLLKSRGQWAEAVAIFG